MTKLELNIKVSQNCHSEMQIYTEFGESFELIRYLMKQFVGGERNLGLAPSPSKMKYKMVNLAL